MEKIDVSVVIPYFRDNNTIERAVDSIIMQTVKVKEIIIVDDCSNRKVDKITLNQLVKKSDIINIISRKKNGGPGEARNIGIDIAKSKYIAFLDSDDIWQSNKIEKQYKIMEETNAFLSGHKSSIVNKEGNVKVTGEIKEITPIMQFIKNRFPTRSVMLKNNNKYRFERNKRYAEDFLLWTQIILNNEKAIIIDEVLANSFKENFGESGLTSNLKEMYRGGIASYKTLKSEKKINMTVFTLLTIYQTFKYIYRLIRFWLKKVIKK
ncbi:hypothetical protein SEQU_10250 [Staphylococcus equorum UMC-CNS-924]|uniref:glycosyltransferase family 2 protein n=1 Tax=Staphylococcus equorum TaxID=246432 RepID=UPI0003974FEF|nr:glycosyltransferase family 2 protein [Staphylococcus equorum]ERH34504.1 hypothetical protein SEQU_10250 [Staphylococcus equorum UMC-CNS-924]MEB8172357.1 glycosyltransferase [Staphylococcus equorum]